MRILYILICFLVSNAAFAQSKWEYGVHFQFNNSLVKPVAADTFNARPGYGAGFLLEYKFKSLSLQFLPSFTHISYENGISNRIHVTDAADVAWNAVLPIDKNKQTFLILGALSSYTFGYTERNFLGQSLNPLNTTLDNNRFEMGVHLGLGLDLNPGARLTASYMDYLSGKQHSSRITHRIDYFQIGLQVRVNELSSSDRVQDKHNKEKQEIRTAKKQIEQLHQEGNGILVFVINKKAIQTVNYLKNQSKEEMKAAQDTNLMRLEKAIRQFYTFGDFVITTDSAFNPQSRNITTMVGEERIQYKIPSDKTIFYARIDELFLEENNNLKWGIFVFDEYMQMLKKPFPMYIPYRDNDKEFAYTDSMIQEFNTSLKTFYQSRDSQL